MALGVAQIGWQFACKKPIEMMQRMSLLLVLGFGAATLITDDPRFVMVKPSLIYVIVGLVMLKPGWMNRYLPPAAVAVVPDISFIFGFVLAGLMFFSAALNLLVDLAVGEYLTGVAHPIPFRVMLQLNRPVTPELGG